MTGSEKAANANVTLSPNKGTDAAQIVPRAKAAESDDVDRQDLVNA
jgi:hypothetical protein